MAQVDRSAEYYKPVDVGVMTAEVAAQLGGRGHPQPPEIIRATIVDLVQKARVTFYVPHLALNRLTTTPLESTDRFRLLPEPTSTPLH